MMPHWFFIEMLTPVLQCTLGTGMVMKRSVSSSNRVGSGTEIVPSLRSTEIGRDATWDRFTIWTPYFAAIALRPVALNTSSIENLLYPPESDSQIVMWSVKFL